LPTTVCLISEKNHSEDAHYAAAHAALCYEKSINLKTFPSELLCDFHAKNTLNDFIISEKITYLIPVTQTAANLLTNFPIPASVKILTHALYLSSASFKQHDAPLIAYTQQDGYLHVLPPFSAINDTSHTAGKPHKTSADIIALAEEANQHFSPRGGWGFDPNDRCEPIPLSTAQATLLRQLGINLWLLPIFEKNGQPISIVTEKIPGPLSQTETGPTELTLTINRLYLDMDDTLYVHGKPNPYILKLLEKCTNIGCLVTLITRHFQEPSITLVNYNIPVALFNEILWITDGSPKSNHIKLEPNTVFIDDSFHERQEVSGTLSIPAFTPDIAEILIPKLK